MAPLTQNQRFLFKGPRWSKLGLSLGWGQMLLRKLGLTAVKQGKKMRNIAGNEVAIFLFQFELRGAGIDFVLNEGIAADMYQDLDAQLKPLVHACCETLSRYRPLSISKIMMDGNFLLSGEFEVMLSKGLGRHFRPQEKARLFQDAKQIADLLTMVMNRSTQAEKAGRPQQPSALDHSTSFPPDRL